MQDVELSDGGEHYQQAQKPTVRSDAWPKEESAVKAESKAEVHNFLRENCD
jgi:hypothetical protein